MKTRPPNRSSALFRLCAIALSWFCAISVLHAWLNGEAKPPGEVVVGYMPVITNLAAPLVDEATRGESVHFKAVKFGSFAEMGEAFSSGHIQVAFIIAPMAIALHAKGVPLKVVYIGNRHESTMVVRPDLSGRRLEDLAGKTVAVPSRYAGHLLAIRRALRERGMDPGAIRTVEIPPPDMPAALATGAIDGYFVGEPFASKAIQSGRARRFLDVESIWPHFICNLAIVREELIRTHPEYVQRLVDVAVRSCLRAGDDLDLTAGLVAKHWGVEPGFVKYVLTNPPGRIRYDLYTPSVAEIEDMAREMQQAGLLDANIDLTGMVEDRFAKAVPVSTTVPRELVSRQGGPDSSPLLGEIQGK